MYRTQTEDTTIEAERIFFDLVRTLSIETRIMQYHRASIQSQQIWWDLFKERNNIPDKQLKKKYINLKLGEKYCSISQLLDIDFMIAYDYLKKLLTYIPQVKM